MGKDHYYLAKKTEDSIDMFRYMENLRYVEYVGSQRASKSTLLLVPDAGTILADKLPAQAPFYQAAALYRAAGSVCKQTTFVDIRQAMNEQKKSEQLYYRTDHHWTLAGAYVGYQQLCQPLHLTKQPYEHFKPKMVSKNFLGIITFPCAWCRCQSRYDLCGGSFTGDLFGGVRWQRKAYDL